MNYSLVTLKQVQDWLNDANIESEADYNSIRHSMSSFIESITNKQFITRKYVEFRDGMGRESINVRRYPIYKVVELWDDLDREFTDTNFQIASTDFVIDHDFGKITLYNDESIFSDGKQNVKIEYWAGYSRFHVIDEVNNYIDVTDTGGTAAVEIAENSDQQTRFEGYSAEDLASTLQTALNADGTLNGTYTITYNHNTQKFNIACDENCTILWNTGTNTAKNMAGLMGFQKNNTSSGQSHTSDFGVTGIPGDIEYAAKRLIKRIWMERDHNREDILKEVIDVGSIRGSGGTREFVKNALPEDVKVILDNYTTCYL